MAKALCIYHGNCADGFTAAWVIRKALGDVVEFYPGVYQNPPPDVSGRDVIMVDFSYKRPVIEAMIQSGDVKQANTILILDHHKTAADDLAGLTLPEGYQHPGAYDPEYWRRKWEGSMEWPVRSIFDMDRSGAQLAWDFFFPDEPRPSLVDYVADRDLWKFERLWSREINAVVFSYPYDFKAWDEMAKLIENDFDDFASQGAAIERKHHKDVAELVGVTRRRMKIGGHDVPVANLPYTLTSDAGHLMAKGEPFAACYWDTPDGRVMSLRSTDDGMDVSAIAKAYGGGGHPRASGFRMPLGWEGDAS